MGALGVGTSETEGNTDTDREPPEPRRGSDRRHGDSARAAVRPRSLRRTAVVLGGALAFYLLVAIALWWHAWSGHPTTATTCGCGDSALFLWFLEWPAYALAHGHNPFFSTALFHPGGINLLANTSVLAIGIPLAPVTWLFGPVATLNVASTLGPALSALAMFWLLRRWVRWTPAAMVGGLVFGFSPFVVVNLAGAHLMTGVLVLLPLMVACLDELLVRQRRSAAKVGAVLGLLVSLQFFLGTEVLTIVVLFIAAGLALLVAYAALGHRDELAARAPHAGRGLVAAAAVALVLLAYPVWFALDGPAHLTGLVWPTIPPGSGGITLGNLWHPGYMTALRNEMQVTGGYEGPALLQAEYLGLGMIIVLVAGVVAWRRDRRLWLFGALGVVAVMASLGTQTYWTPWRLFTHVPLIQNVITARIAIITSLCAAIMLAVIVDRTYSLVALWARGLAVKSAPHHRSAPKGVLAGVLAAGSALVVAAVAVVPVGSALASNAPLTTRAVALPAWFSEVAPHLPPGQVVLTYPAPFALQQSAEAWQAVDSLDFAMVGGSGPGSILRRAGQERAGQAVIGAASFSLEGPPKPTAANIDAIRHALVGWGVTRLVVPNPSSLPRYEQGTNPSSALGLFTVALGRNPMYQADGWVWSDVSALGPRLAIATPAFVGCTTPQLLFSPSHQAVPDCVLAASHRSS
jgi:hypothetical protein